MKTIINRMLIFFAVFAVMSGGIAVTSYFTAPLIEMNSGDMAYIDSMLEVLPPAESFEVLAPEGLPKTVTSVFSAKNGAGYVFILDTAGFHGPMKLILGMDAAGLITGAMTLEHEETPDIGAKTAEEPFRSQFVGKDSQLLGVETISGATASSTAYIKAVKDAFDAYVIINGGSVALDEDPVGLTPEKLERYYPGVSEFKDVKAGNTRGIICGDEGYVVFKKYPGFESTLDVAVLFDTKDEIIGVVLNEIADTPNVGMLCAESEFTSQFIGVSDPAKVDGVSGATESSNGVKKAVAAAITALADIKALA
ncbi:MAG: FMN-binding protein [Oscillospiraceae bacterium]